MKLVVGEDADDDDEFITYLDGDSWSVTSIQGKMERLKSKHVKGPLFKLRVDEDDILNDAVAFYKSPLFDATRPLRVSFNNQPAIDTGGVMRDFFSTVKEQFITSQGLNIFEGPHQRLLFNYNQSCLAAGIPQILGKIVAHSLVQGCGGFPYLAPSHFYYISTGDIQRAAAYTSIHDVYDTEKQDLLQKVENKLIIAEAIVSYHVLIKRAAMLDNFAKGLETLGVLTEIKQNRRQFEEVFLHNEQNVQASTVLEKVMFTTEDTVMETMLSVFIWEATHQELESFLKFVAGTSSLPLKPITVEVDESPSIFASTCLVKLTLPELLKSQGQDVFCQSMQAAIRQEGGAFNTY